MNILVDSSVWIDYFRSAENSEQLDTFIDQNLVCTNYLILAELIPFLKLKKQTQIAKLLLELNIFPLETNWKRIIEYQTKCLKNGINKIGIPDLIILDNIVQHDLTLFTLDKHFSLIQKIVKFNIITN